MLLLWVSLTAMAVSPRVHEYFHADAHDPLHSCAVTHLEQQGVSAAPDAIQLCVALPLWDLPALRAESIPSLPALRGREQGRAPPSSDAPPVG
ncbi:MAG TPA: hypothetical protein DCM86_06085 [Verrucomicrobiales bacterium]|nr:hypothetical protein [Verrucomicrobiales bacterium]